MSFIRQLEINRRALLDDIFRRIEDALKPFARALDCFLAALFQSRLPVDWRQQWHAFVADQATKGFKVNPQSVRELEEWIEAWARFCGLLPVIDSHVAEAEAADEGTGIDFARRRQITQLRSEVFFDQKLDEAQAHLFAISRLLEALGDKLDVAKFGVEIDVDSEVSRIEELIWLYNDALESARDAWLRDDLTGEASVRLLEMRSPASLGLLMFTDEQQAQRAERQGLEIGERMRQRDVTMGRVIVGVRTVEYVGVAAGVLLGGGVVATAIKKGGKWAVVKLIVVAGATIAAEQGVEEGLRYAGASEQTIRGWRLAAAVVTFILLRRRSQAAAEPQRPTPPKPPTASRPEAPKDPGRTPSDGPSGQLENASGNPNEAVRTQPHGHGSLLEPDVPNKPRLPPVGSRERAAIETARRQGISAAKANELEAIRAGGTGSGVWTELSTPAEWFRRLDCGIEPEFPELRRRG